MTLLLPFMTCGMMGDIAPTRPLTAEAEVLVTTSARVPVGMVPARVRWTEVLDGPDRLDSVSMPKWFLKQSGMRVSRPELSEFGWCIRFLGHWYTLDRVVSDNETAVAFAGKSLEVSDFKRNMSSTGLSGFQMTAAVPTEIMDALFSGGGGEWSFTDPDFTADLTYPFSASLWQYEYLSGATAPDPEWQASFTYEEWGESYAYGTLEHNWIDDLEFNWGTDSTGEVIKNFSASDHSPPFCLHLPYCPNTTDTPRAIYEWGGVCATGDWFEAGTGTQFRVSAQFALHGVWNTNEAWLRAPERWDEMVAQGAEMTMELWWYLSDKVTVVGRDRYQIAKPPVDAWGRQYFPSSSTWATAAGDYCRVVVAVTWPAGLTPTPGDPTYGFYGSRFAISGFTIDIARSGGDSGWDYYGSPMNIRATDILHTDTDWIEFGTWTVGAGDISSAVRDNQLSYIVTGDVCTVHFATGEAGSLCSIAVDGTVQVANLDVSAATSYAIVGLDVEVEHLISIKVTAAKKVALEKLVVNPQRRITVNWPDMNMVECVDELLSAVGGEVFPDTENKRLYHVAALGDDLLAENILDLRRGTNLLSCDIEKQRDVIVNRLRYLGYGTGSTRLRLVVDGQGVNGDGLTSQAVYGVQQGRYENADCQDWYLGKLEAQALVNEWQWPAVEYRVTCPDDTAAYIHAGDTVRVYWDADPDDIINVAVRVLELTRDNEGGVASMVVGTRVTGLPDQLAATARKLDRVSRNL
jgi:hypothetical protein